MKQPEMMYNAISQLLDVLIALSVFAFIYIFVIIMIHSLKKNWEILSEKSKDNYKILYYIGIVSLINTNVYIAFDLLTSYGVGVAWLIIYIAINAVIILAINEYATNFNFKSMNDFSIKLKHGIVAVGVIIFGRLAVLVTFWV